MLGVIYRLDCEASNSEVGMGGGGVGAVPVVGGSLM